jgi:hypothetical protein
VLVHCICQLHRPQTSSRRAAAAVSLKSGQFGAANQHHLGTLHNTLLRHELLLSIAARIDSGVVQLEHRHFKYHCPVIVVRHTANIIQFSGVLVFAGLYYAFKGRHVYAGPVAYVRKDLQVVNPVQLRILDQRIKFSTPSTSSILCYRTVWLPWLCHLEIARRKYRCGVWDCSEGTLFVEGTIILIQLSSSIKVALLLHPLLSCGAQV